MMTVILTIESGQKDIFLRRANVKKILDLLCVSLYFGAMFFQFGTLDSVLGASTFIFIKIVFGFLFPCLTWTNSLVFRCSCLESVGFWGWCKPCSRTQYDPAFAGAMRSPPECPRPHHCAQHDSRADHQWFEPWWCLAMNKQVLNKARTLFQKLWLLLDKRAKLDLRSTKQLLMQIC